MAQIDGGINFLVLALFLTTDINECLLRNNDCSVAVISDWSLNRTASVRKCVDTLGGYYCLCQPGFVRKGRICQGKLLIVYLERK